MEGAGTSVVLHANDSSTGILVGNRGAAGTLEVSDGGSVRVLDEAGTAATGPDFGDAIFVGSRGGIVLVGDEVDAGTSFAWRGHEHDPDCGYAIPVRSDRAAACRILLDEMVDLATMVEAALDAAEAYSIANSLFET